MVVACVECGSTTFRRIANNTVVEKQSFDTTNGEWDFSVISEETMDAGDWTCANEHALSEDVMNAVQEEAMA